MPFVKGQSGNPSGRPKIPQDVKDLARGLVPDAIKALGEIVKDGSAPPASRVSAASTILDRAYGKPAQTVNATIARTIVTATDAELAAIAFGGGGGGSAEEDSPVQPDRVH